MELNVKLPQEILSLFQLRDEEEIRYSSPFDINRQGQFTNSSYGILTNNRLIIVEDRQIVYEKELAELSAMTVSYTHLISL